MKSLIIFFVLITTSTVFACTNFSGNYGSISMENYTDIAQKDCDSITIDSGDGNAISAIADGQWHEAYRGEIISEGEVIAQIVIFSKLVFAADKMVLDVKLTIEGPSLTEDESEVHMIASLNSDGDLVMTSNYKDGEPTTTILKRK